MAKVPRAEGDGWIKTFLLALVSGGTVMRLKLRVFGVPLHPLLVHFPITFWLVVPVLDIAALFAGPEPWWTSGEGCNHSWHRNWRRLDRGGFAGVSSAFARWHRSETRSTAWNYDNFGLVHIHHKGRGCSALAACRLVNDRVSHPRSDWLRIACPRRLSWHAAGLPTTRGGIAASRRAHRMISCSNAPVGLRIVRRVSRRPQAPRQHQPLS